MNRHTYCVVLVTLLMSWTFRETLLCQLVPVSPQALPATNISATQFTANWNPVSGVVGYQLDVATDDKFTSYVPGFNKLTVAGGAKVVTGLKPGTAYFYRVRVASKGGGASANSNVVTLRTAFEMLLRTLPKVHTIPPPTTIPNVASYSPLSPVATGATITFSGYDLGPSIFTATIGGQQCQILPNGTSSSIQATAPASTVVGDLIVSHGSASTATTLAKGYIVYGSPSISSVTPSSFRYGQSVTLSGSSLFTFNAGPVKYNYGDFIKIGGDNTVYETGPIYVRVANWQASVDGTTATFTPLDAWNMRPAAAAANPQPGSLSGVIRLVKQGSTSAFDLTGPSVTWAPVSLTIQSIVYPDWSPYSSPHVAGPIISPYFLADFGAYNGQHFLYLKVTGTGLSGASASIGSKSYPLTASTDGSQGTVGIAYGDQSGYFVATKGNERAQSADMVKILPGPRINLQTTDPELMSWTPMTLKIGKLYTLYGWDFGPPAGATGLTIGLTFGVSASALQQCALAFNVVTQSANQLSFRVDSTGTVPNTCSLLRPLPGGGYPVTLIVSYGGANIGWWQILVKGVAR